MSLKKIAEITGVSISTVSRVLNQSDYKCATQETKDLIWKTAQELNYSPNLSAKNLRKGLNTLPFYKISILLARQNSLKNDLFFAELFRSVEEELFNQNCILHSTVTLDDTSLALDRSDLWGDGVIILGRCSQEHLKEILKIQTNCILIGRNPSRVPIDEIFCDGYKAACMAVEHLISSNYQNISYIGDCSYETRYLGYTDTLTHHQIPLDFSRIRQTNQTQQAGYEATLDLLSNTNTDAIFCANDMTALGALEAIRTVKKSSKKPLPAIIGIDNIELCSHTNPSLSTINIPKNDMGKMAVKTLIDRIKKGHKETLRVEFQCRLIKRESCTR